MENKTPYLVITSDRAQKDIIHVWEWYEDRQIGLGEKLIIELNSKVRQIEQNPELYSIKAGNQREVNINTFPIQLVYRISKKKRIVVITSVFHTSRNPNKK